MLIFFIHCINSHSCLRNEQSGLIKDYFTVEGEVLNDNNVKIDSFDSRGLSIFKKSLLFEKLGGQKRPLQQEDLKFLIEFVDERINATFKERHLLEFACDVNDTIDLSFNNLDSFKEYFLPNISDDIKKFCLQIIFLTIRFVMFVEREYNSEKKNENSKKIQKRLFFLLSSLVDHKYLNGNKNDVLYTFADRFYRKVLSNSEEPSGKLQGIDDLKDKFLTNITESYLEEIKIITVRDSEHNIIDKIILTLFED